MAELKADRTENHNSDSEFEKVQYPGDEDMAEEKSAELEDTRKILSALPTDSESVREHHPGAKARKSMLEANVNDQQQNETRCYWATAIDPKVQDLIYWQDVRKSALVFCSSLVILTIFGLFPLLNIISYASLFVLTFTFAFRLYGNAVACIKKSKEKHPLSKYLEKDISIHSDSIHNVADQLVENITKVIDDLRKLFLIERFLDSIKFALLLWLMTFLGSWLSGMSLLIIGDVILFTIPKVYRVYQKQIDEFLALVNSKLEILQKAIHEKFQRKGKIE